MTDSRFWIKSIRFSVGKGLRLVAPFVSRVGRVVASSRPKRLWCGQWSERDLRRSFPSRYEKKRAAFVGTGRYRPPRAPRFSKCVVDGGGARKTEINKCTKAKRSNFFCREADEIYMRSSA